MSETDDLLDDLLSWRAPDQGATDKGGLSSPSVPTNVLLGPCGGKPAVASVASAALPVGDEAKEVELQFNLPADITAKLFPHQREGIQWLYRKHCRARACLLADEMGLGKTIQVSVFLGELYRRGLVKTTVVVVPATLLPMWEKSLHEWGRVDRKHIEVVHNESQAKRHARWRKLTYGIPCVMLTTYGVLRRDATAMSATMLDYVILDEAHLIKEYLTDTFKAARMLSARHKIAMTGTPLMNRFTDMWSIFEFLDGSILDSDRRTFLRVNGRLLRGNERDASARQQAAAESELVKMQNAIRPYMLRREKKDLGAVESTKHDTVLWVRLSETQENLYRAFLTRTDVMDAVTAAAPANDDDGSSPVEEEPVVEEGGGSGADRSNPLVLLTILQQICNHPWLQLTDEAFRAALPRPISEAVCAEVGDISSGAKLPVAVAIVRDCAAAGRKVLVFSRSKRLLSMLSRLLQEHAVTHVRIDGDTANMTARFRAVEAFNADSSVSACLLTTQVGGVGLTFDSASCVVLLDPSWNPSADSQAVDRVHRIGQKHQHVFIYRLITSGTVEEKVYRNQVFKLTAARQSLQSTGGQPEHFFRYFTRIQLGNMFVLGNTAESQTAAQLALLHPGRVDAQVRQATADLPSLCGISDNGCILQERVAASEEETDLITAQTPSLSQRKRPRSVSGSPTPSQRRSPSDAIDRGVGAGSGDDEDEAVAGLSSLVKSLAVAQDAVVIDDDDLHHTPAKGHEDVVVVAATDPQSPAPTAAAAEQRDDSIQFCTVPHTAPRQPTPEADTAPPPAAADHTVEEVPSAVTSMRPSSSGSDGFAECLEEDAPPTTFEEL